MPASSHYDNPELLMTGQEADQYLQNYRTLLKTWTMAVAGFAHGDTDSLCRELELRHPILADIARIHPEKSYSVDMLMNARSRTWAGFSDEREPRPANRRT
jgi:hypothetical protein